MRDICQREEAAATGRAFDLEIIPVVVVKAVERLDDQVVDGKPYRTSPVRVSPEHGTVRISRGVADD